ncbi:hypothetical protein [Neobacillus niacini]|uniref:hypothetical protein n=1 Tax=Neobacillus niacini TaxID=86668 RepID=UPI00187C19DE|nr:hypothetical protein [Neobacillus niacini]
MTGRAQYTHDYHTTKKLYGRVVISPYAHARIVSIEIVGPEGVKVKPINEIFHEQLQLKKGEFLIQVATDERYIHAPFISIKRRQQWETGYPLITVAALKMDGEIRTAISGLCPFPFRSKKMEAPLNNREISVQERIQSTLAEMPSPILNDVEGSSEYRLFVLQNLLEDVLGALDIGERK